MAQNTTTPAAKPDLDLTGSRQFTAWLHEQQASLAFTTYQSGKLFLMGIGADGRLSVFERTFSRCMDLWSDSQTLCMSTLYQLGRFAKAPGRRSMISGCLQMSFSFCATMRAKKSVAPPGGCHEKKRTSLDGYA